MLAVIADVAGCCDALFAEICRQSLKAHDQVLDDRAVLLGKSEEHAEHHPGAYEPKGFLPNSGLR